MKQDTIDAMGKYVNEKIEENRRKWWISKIKDYGMTDEDLSKKYTERYIKRKLLSKDNLEFLKQEEEEENETDMEKKMNHSVPTFTVFQQSYQDIQGSCKC